MRHLLRLSPLLRSCRRQIAVSLLALVFLTIAQLAIPSIIRNVIDIGLARGQVGYIINSSLLILGLGISVALLTYVQRYLSEWIASHIGYDLRNRLYDHIQHLSFSYHDKAQTGQLISRCIEDVRSIERFTGFGVVELIRLFFLFIGIIALLFSTNARLAAIALVPIVPLALITTNFGSKIGAYFLKIDQSLGELSSRLQENVSGVQVVRAFAREAFEISRFDETNRILYHNRVSVISEFSKIMPTTHFLVTSGTLLILWFGGRMVLNGDMTIGEIVAFNGYLILLAAPTQQLTWLVNLAGEAIAGVQRTFEVLDTKPAISSSGNAIDPGTLSGEVAFENVCFQYQGENIPALNRLDFKIAPNQIVALIGPTGSGKTSLVNLIPRFYDVNEGTVKVDGHDVRDLDLISLRKQIGIVLQTSLLFSTTIRENIAYGRPEASFDSVIEAAKAAQAHEFISELPEGYDTVVGERGVTLSGGQRQRVAIARALLLNPRILILDDSTSSVDMQTERLIQQALDTLMQARTTFVIAHRLSTVHRADKILVMDNGQIIESGVHQELLDLNGLYREIYDLQLIDQERFQSEIAAVADTPFQVYQTREDHDHWAEE